MFQELCNRNGLFGLVALAGLSLSGCGQTQPDAVQTPAQPAATEAAEAEHSEWWCNEHGVPEEICARCSTKLAAEFQQKNDWCKHERPESQCFVCHPELEARFAAQYEAKYGKQPPKPEPEEEPKS